MLCPPSKCASIDVRSLSPNDPEVPPSVRRYLTQSLQVKGSLVDAHRIAIVGKRECDPEARTFALDLAAACARAGWTVVSGGASGIDRAAHEGALRAGGRTWAFLPTSPEHVFPRENEKLFDVIAGNGGALIWPYLEGVPARSPGFRFRNRLLVNAAEHVVVIQAGARSGSIHAAHEALRAKRPLWVASPPFWSKNFDGSKELLQKAGARALFSIAQLLEVLGIPKMEEPCREAHSLADPRGGVPPFSGPLQEKIWASLSYEPQHIEAICLKLQEPCQTVQTELLTMTLEDVVVEQPSSFFRRSSLCCRP